MTANAIICLLAAVSLNAAPTPQDATVKIYTYRGDRSTSQGSGFLSSGQGEVVTAYHVVRGAQRIEISNAQIGLHTDIEVEYVSNVFDIAVLQIRHSGPTPHLELSFDPPRQADSLEIIGFPLGNPLMTFHVDAPRNDFLSSLQMFDKLGTQIFRLNIDIIPLAFVGSYSGMSGAPVLNHGRVVGIFSGSYQEGASLAWAIPSRYIPGNNRIGLPPSGVDWQPLQLMSPNWTGLRELVRVNTSAASIYEEYFDQVEALAQAYDDLRATATALNQRMSMFEIYAREIVDNPNLANTSTWQEERDDTVDLLSKFGHAHDLSAEKEHQVGIALNKLVVWITDRASVDEKTERILDGRVRAITSQHKDMAGSLAKYLNVDPVMAKAIADFLLVVQQGNNQADLARAWLRFSDRARHCVVAYGSYEAVNYTNTRTSMFRQIGQVLEPVVYPAEVPRP